MNKKSIPDGRCQTRGSVLLLVQVACFLMVLSSAAMAVSPESKDFVRMKPGGTLSVDVTDASLKTVLGKVGEIAGFRVSLNGLADTAITKKLEDVPLEKGIRMIVGNRSISILYETGQNSTGKPVQVIRSIWVFDAVGGMSTAAAEPEEDPMGVAPKVDVSKHANFLKPEIATDYDADSKEGYWVRQLAGTPALPEMEKAVAELVKIDTDSAIAAVSMAMDNNDPMFRKSIIDQLAQSENPLSEQLIGQALHKDDDLRVNMSALKALENRESQIALEFVYSAFYSHKNEKVRRNVGKALAQMVAQQRHLSAP